MTWLDWYVDISKQLIIILISLLDHIISSIGTGEACGITCNLLQNGFGRWVDGLWRPYTGMYSTGRSQM